MYKFQGGFGVDNLLRNTGGRKALLTVRLCGETRGDNGGGELYASSLPILAWYTERLLGFPPLSVTHAASVSFKLEISWHPFDGVLKLALPSMSLSVKKSWLNDVDDDIVFEVVVFSGETSF